MDAGIAGKCVLVTGGSRGIGRAVVELFAAEGAEVTFVYHRDADAAREVVDAAHRAGQRVAAEQADVRDRAACAAVVERAIERWDRIDVLVNNAGHGYSAAIEEGEESEIRRMFEANFFALAAMTRRVLAGMRARGRGHIVNISSVGGLVGNPASGYYNATKFAVEGLSQALAKEVAPLGIRVTLIEPGPFRTDFQGRSMTAVAKPIDAYATTAGARRAQLLESSGKQAGDPARAADAIINIVESDKPPLHLVLGKNAVQRVREELREVLRSVDAWEAVSVATDFPES
jgi:NAD(P)-dependent dehydrogenase (short-subunit alcohol dehydrogenase family)